MAMQGRAMLHNNFEVNRAGLAAAESGLVQGSRGQKHWGKMGAGLPPMGRVGGAFGRQ